MAAAEPDSVPAYKKTEEDLRRELEELERQKQQIDERLRESISARRYVRPAGRGGPQGLGPGGQLRPSTGIPLRASLGRGLPQRGLVRSAEEMDGEEPEQPVRKKRLLSAVVKVNSGAGGEDLASTAEEAGKPSEPSDVDRLRTSTGHRDVFRPQEGPSSVAEEAAGAAPPRVLPVERDAGVMRRNRRMFGALLLGTLEKFKEEDKRLQGSEAYVRRNNSLQRAEQKKREASERLRQRERQEAEDRRRRDMMLRARLAAKAEEKQLELLLLQWSAHQTRLTSFLRTKTQPAIHFQPAHPCKEVEHLLEGKQTELEAWRQERTAEVQEYCKRLQDECVADVDAELARWRRGEPARGPRAAVAVAVAEPNHEPPQDIDTELQGGTSDAETVPNGAYPGDESMEAPDGGVAMVQDEKEVATDDGDVERNHTLVDFGDENSEEKLVPGVDEPSGSPAHA